MSTVRFTSIIVTSQLGDELIPVREKAIEIFKRLLAEDPVAGPGAHTLVGAIMPGLVNSDATFLIAPDGSKDGWQTAEVANKARAEFIKYLREWHGDHVDFVEIVMSRDLDYVCVTDKSIATLHVLP